MKPHQPKPVEPSAAPQAPGEAPVHATRTPDTTMKVGDAVAATHADGVDLGLRWRSTTDKVYVLRPEGGLPWFRLQAESRLTDDRVRELAVAHHEADRVNQPYPLEPETYVRALSRAEVVAYTNSFKAAEMEQAAHQSARRACECLYRIIEGLSNLPPARWTQEVLSEVASNMGLDESHIRERVASSGRIPSEWDKPLQVNGPAGLHVRQALGACAEAIYLRANMLPCDAVSGYNFERLFKETDLKAWAASHPILQGFYEHAKDFNPSMTEEKDILETAYLNFVDRVGKHLITALTEGSGHLNPAISLDSAGKPEHFAWPGGYPLYYITKDNGVLSPEAVEENQRLTNDPDDPQWFVVEVRINEEDTNLICDHTGERIPSAYAEVRPVAPATQESLDLVPAGSTVSRHSPVPWGKDDGAIYDAKKRRIGDTFCSEDEGLTDEQIEANADLLSKSAELLDQRESLRRTMRILLTELTQPEPEHYGRSQGQQLEARSLAIASARAVYDATATPSVSGYSQGPWSKDDGAIYDKKGRRVADTFCSEDQGLTDEEVEANAALFAQAPRIQNQRDDLRKALGDLLAELVPSKNDPRGRTHHQQMEDQIRAIASARKACDSIKD